MISILLEPLMLFSGTESAEGEWACSSTQQGCSDTLGGPPSLFLMVYGSLLSQVAMTSRGNVARFMAPFFLDAVLMVHRHQHKVRHILSLSWQFQGASMSAQQISSLSWQNTGTIHPNTLSILWLIGHKNLRVFL